MFLLDFKLQQQLFVEFEDEFDNLSKVVLTPKNCGVTEQVDVVTQQVFVILLHGHVPEHAGEFIHLGGDDLDQEDAVAEALLLVV